MGIILSLILISLGVGLLVLIHICIVGRAIRHDLTDSNVAANIADRGSLGSSSMSREDIEKLPCFGFVEREIKGSNSPCPNCAVCLENFKVAEKCRLLPLCNHSFHAECVDLWLLRAPVCPICRASADLIETHPLHGEEGNNLNDNRVESRDGSGADPRVENEGGQNVFNEQVSNLNSEMIEAGNREEFSVESLSEIKVDST
ncbi:RING-H2 finger protein ATL74-like [Andrographis paniculata]|uniref:RING-H2 finger protein ATL74-like n=1 Tax=Andrographis paniculata TaxID=175694 RepID=UPI0021E7683F|nr:RING-H2 finger protein ATL74-like [Andrographis paniculata]